MTRARLLILLTVIASVAHAHAHEREGYVLKPGEGERASLPGSIIKASPTSGTKGGVAILQTMGAGFSTGLHYHTHADEFFYVVSGSGKATIKGTIHPIQAGDFIFVPAGQDHKLETSKSLEVLEFLDQPGLDRDFRHVFPHESGFPQTLEELNAISTENGSVYKTFD